MVRYEFPSESDSTFLKSGLKFYEVRLIRNEDLCRDAKSKLSFSRAVCKLSDLCELESRW